MIHDVRRSQGHRPLAPYISIPASLAVVTLAYVVAALVARTVPLANLPTLVLAASFPYVPLAALCAAILSALRRRKLLTAVSVILLTISVAIQVPWQELGRSSGTVVPSTELRVLSLNIRRGEAHTAAFVGLAVASADIITMSELTAEAAGRFREGGLRKTFPYSILIPRPGAGGMGLWSRYPLMGLSPSRYGSNFIAARVRVPGVRHDPLVASVHLVSPLAGGANTFTEWHRQITAAKAEFADWARTAGPAAVIIAGDFNATPDMRQFRDLLNVGYRDAVAQTRVGFSPTYSPHPAIPPVITIDHVLTRNSVAESIRTVDIPGSDHRALLATVAVPSQ